MSRTYTLHPTAMYGGRGPRNMYLSGFSAWSGKRIGWFKDGSTDYAGAVSFYFDFSPVMGHTRESIKLTLTCSNTFAYAVPVLYNPKSTDSTTDWTVPDYATVECEKHGTIPTLDLTPWGLPDHDAYVVGGYYRTYSYVDVTDAVLTVVTAETTKKVTYNGNGGSSIGVETLLWGETVWDGYLTTTVPTRTGYQFTGWNTQANGTGTSYASGAYISVTADTVLYAQWTPLYSILNSASNANITEATTVQWTNRGSFTTKLKFVFGSVNSGEITVTGTSYNYTLPSSWYNQIPNSTSGTATVYLYTYVGSTLIGTSSRTFTAYVKSTVVPSINNPTATGVNLKWSLYLQKYSSVKISVTGGAAGTGATIKSYSITGPGLSYSVNTTATSANATSAVLATSGTATYTVTITDSRGRTAQKTVSITVTAYAEPAIYSVTGVRCNSDGTVNQTTGTSIKATSVFTWTAVGQNSLTRTLSYKKHTASSYTEAQTGISSDISYVIAVGLAEISSSYDVKVEISDSLGNSASYVTIVPPVAGIAFGLKNDRARFGGPVEKPGLQVDWNAEFNGVLDVTPRRCYATLPQRGWYRVFNVTSGLGRAGSAFSIVLHIGRSFSNNNNELHTVTLLANYYNQEFSSEVSKSNTLGITKVRYTADGSNNGHIDIYYDLTAENNVYVDFDVHCRPEYLYLIRYNAVTPTAVATSPSGETVLTEYTFAANTMQQSVTIPSSQFSSGNGTIWGSESNIKLVWDNKKVVMTGFIFIQNPAAGVLYVNFPTPTGFPYDKFNGNWVIVGQTYRRAGSYMQPGDFAYGVVNSSVIRIAERNVFASHQATDYAMITIPTATYYFD